MTADQRYTDPSPKPWILEAGKLWAGGVATAIVAALVATVGILLARGVLKIAVLAPKESGVWGDASTVTYSVVAAAAGLVATGLIHLLIVGTPSPFSFFGWIIGLATIVAIAIPFTINAALAPMIATAVINAAIGVSIGTLTASNARRSMRRRPPPAPPAPPAPQTQWYPQDPR